MTFRILEGDARARLSDLPDASVRCCVTSPPYWGLRDYGVAGQLGLEETPADYTAALVDVFREVRRVLADDGTLWLNLGDSYVAAANGNIDTSTSTLTSRNDGSRKRDLPETGRIRGGRGTRLANGRGVKTYRRDTAEVGGPPHKAAPLLKAKDLVGIPWRVAFALQDDGWWLRQDIIWSKPNPMPESVRDRCTKAHEYLFLLSKSARYYYDAVAIAEPIAESTAERLGQPNLEGQWGSDRVPGKTNGRMKAVPPRFGGSKYGDNEDMPRTKSGRPYFRDVENPDLRNRRSVWTISTQPFTEAHFATFPPKLVEPCILAGSQRGDTVLDPFAGAGTTLLVAERLGRDSVGVELNPDYAAMARARIVADAPLLTREGGAR